MKNNVFAIERKRLGLTQEQLAKRLNTSRSNIANWENGLNMPSIDLLLKCSSLFGCDVMYLIGYQSEKNKEVDNIPEPIYEDLYNYDDYDEVKLLEIILKKNNLLSKNEFLTKKDYSRFIEFIKANKNFIILKKDK